MKTTSPVTYVSIITCFILAITLSMLQCQSPEEENESNEVSVSIIEPSDNMIFSGCIVYDLIEVDVTSTSEIEFVEIYVNDVLIGTDGEAPYNFEWNPHDFTPEPDPYPYLSNLLQRFPILENIFEYLDPALINSILSHLIKNNPDLQDSAEMDEAIRIKAIAYDIEGNTEEDSRSVNTGPDSPSCNCSSKLLLCLEKISPLNPISRCFSLAQRCASDCPGEECCESQCMDSLIEATDYCDSIKDRTIRLTCQKEVSRFDCTSICEIDDGSDPEKGL